MLPQKTEGDQGMSVRRAQLHKSQAKVMDTSVELTASENIPSCSLMAWLLASSKARTWIMLNPFTRHD